jgi:hypothetical protein
VALQKVGKHLFYHYTMSAELNSCCAQAESNRRLMQIARNQDFLGSDKVMTLDN